MKQSSHRLTGFLILMVALVAPVASANDYLGIPLGAPVSSATAQAEPQTLVIEGPFTGLFEIFERYKGQIGAESNRLAMAEAQRAYSSFGQCSDDTQLLWNRLRQAYGSPLPDEDQAWWFDMGNRQRISVNCKIYGGSGKIALNVIVVDTGLTEADQP